MRGGDSSAHTAKEGAANSPFDLPPQTHSSTLGKYDEGSITAGTTKAVERLDMSTVTATKQEPADAQRETYSFTLILSGFTEINEAIEESLYKCGCDDALLSTCDGQASLNFDREAGSWVEAIRSAIADVEKNQLGIKVVQVVPPGEQIINVVNAFLTLRVQTPELSSAFETFFSKLIEHHSSRIAE